MVLEHIAILLVKLHAHGHRVYFRYKDRSGYIGDEGWPPHRAGEALVMGEVDFRSLPNIDLEKLPQPRLDYELWFRRRRLRPVGPSEGVYLFTM